MARISLFRLRDIAERGLWEAQRGGRLLLRRVGWISLVMVVAVMVVAPVWLQMERAAGRLVETRQALKALAADSASSHGPTDSRQRLREFETYLLPYDHVPDTLQDIFRLAETEKLVLQRGEYKVEPDLRGEFMRYRMILPLKGDAQAIYRFMLAALQEHKTLALDSVQFKREQIGASVVEARVQWILLTRVSTIGLHLGTENATGEKP